MSPGSSARERPLSFAWKADLGLCRTWQPSYGAGQYDNSHEIVGNALGALNEAAGKMFVRLEEGMVDEEDGVAAVEAVLARIDEIRASLSDRLEATRTGPSP